MSSSKKLTCKGTLWQVFICERPPPLLGFCLALSSNFVGSESGQIQSVKPLQNMVSNRIQHPTTPSQPHTVCIYCTLTQGRGGGRVEPQRRFFHYTRRLLKVKFATVFCSLLLALTLDRGQCHLLQQVKQS